MLWAAAGLAAILVLLVAFLPELIPGAAARREVEKALSQALGRPVTVDAAVYRWGEGLTVRGLKIGQAGADAGSPLATVKKVRVLVDPVEVARSLTGGDLPVRGIRVEGLELWLIIEKDGRTNLEGLGGGEAQPQNLKIQAIQVTDAIVHVDNRRAGRRLTLRGASASLGELASTGHGYASLSAEIAPAAAPEPATAAPAAGSAAPAASVKPGRFALTANLNRLDLSRPPALGAGGLAGSLKAEWTDINWPELLAVAEADPRLADLAARASGRMSATFARNAWAVEGSLDASNVVAAEGVVIPQAILGFQVRQTGAEKPIDVNLIKLSAPGVDLLVRGTVRVEAAAAADPKSRVPNPPPAFAADLRAEGQITWVPLCQNIEPLRKFAERFERLGGGARLEFRLQNTAAGPRLTGGVDFTDTQLVWRGYIQKDARQLLRLDTDVMCPPDFAWADVTRLELAAEAAGVAVTGRLPLAAEQSAPREYTKGKPPATSRPRLDPLSGAHLEASVDIRRIESLMNLAPVLRSAITPAVAEGPLSLRLTVAPAEAATERLAVAGTATTPADNAPPHDVAADPAAAKHPAWLARLRVDLTKLALNTPGGMHKVAGKRALIDLAATVEPEALRTDLRDLRLALDKASLAWSGSAQVQWPRDSREWPVGRFAGTLELTGVESAGAILSPDAFAPGKAPVSGGAVFDVTADLADGRFRGRMKAGLERLAVAAGDTFVKPAGQPAALTVTALWQSGKLNHVEAEADVDLPGVRLAALGKGEVDLRLMSPGRDPVAAPAAAKQSVPAAEPAAAPDLHVLHFSVAESSTLEVRAVASDLAKAATYSPALARSLNGRRAEGGAEAAVVFALRKNTLHAAGVVDLADAALDFGPTLKKPCGRALRIEATAAVTAVSPQTIEVRLAGSELRLGDSAIRASGRVLLAEPALRSTLAGGALVAALLEDVDLHVTADARHNADLRQALPWLAPMYERCGMEGLTTVALDVAGTPTRGRLHVDADATACRIANAETLLKPAGTPARLRMDLRYGEVPGEMRLDRLAVTLADATATADGRFLFDDPRLVLLAPPSAWSFHLAGRVPDAAILASLFPARLADLKPAGAMQIDLTASADAREAEVQSCRLTFDKARLVWLGKEFLLDGPLSYDSQRLATDGLNLVAGGTDLRLVAYVAHPNDEPTGSVFVRGKQLDLKELLRLIEDTHAHLAAPPGAAAAPGPSAALSDRLARRAQRLLAAARLSVDVAIDRVRLHVADWNATYEPTGMKAEGRLADRQFIMSHFECALNDGTITGEMDLDFRFEPAVIRYAYDARNLKILENLKPFIDTTFPGMQVFGTLSTHVSLTQPIVAGSFAVGRGETVLTDGLLEGPGAPEYITRVLPNLKLTRYPFNRMSNVFENKPNGNVDNRMLFDGKEYDVYIFGITYAGGHTDYELGIDLSVSLGSQTISRTLDQGKLPLVYNRGRIVGSKFAEMEVSYVLPHEFAYNVFVRRNLLLQLIRNIGATPPKIDRPAVVPDVKGRRTPEPRP